MRRIASGELREGETLPVEAALCQEYGVSRSALREAMQTLAAKGFVRIRQGSGTTVGSRDEWHLLDPQFLDITGHSASLYTHLVEARAILEPAIAALAAQRARPEEISRLRDLVAELDQVGDRNPERHAEIDLAFHATLAEASHNPVLVAMHALITRLGREQRQMIARSSPGAVGRAVFWHQHILDAVAQSDATAVQDAMRMHLRQVRAELDDDAAVTPRPRNTTEEAT